MFKFPDAPVNAQPVKASFKRKKTYTVMDKLMVYNLLFDAQQLGPDPKIVELQQKKAEAFNLLFS